MTTPAKQRPPRPELLAPAGSRDALRAALAAGADAVYLAGARFGARAGATFDATDLAWARRVTRAAGRRLYATVNTLVFDAEWPALEAHLEQLAHLGGLGVDAIIVQDLGVLAALRRLGLGVPAHLSTQAAWDGAGAADLLAQLGVTRVILPRETPLATLRRLARDAPFEVEVFVHGAHCYSVSGRCWWSAALGPRSGNRGTCAQPCRRRYAGNVPGRRGAEVPGPHGPEAPWFSPQDLRLLEHTAALQDAGVASLKIEGRLKDAAYVAAVTRAYRAALDGEPDAPTHAAALAEVFGRATLPGFLAGPPGIWRTGAAVGHAGTPVGEVTAPDVGRGRVAAALTLGLAPGDGLAWDEAGTRHGARVTWVDRPGPGSRLLRLRGDAPTRPGLALHRTAVADQGDPFVGWDPAWETVPVTLAASGQAGAPLTLTARAAPPAQSVTVRSEALLEPSRGAGLEQVLPGRLAHLAPPFAPGPLDLTDLPPGLFVPPKAVKALRRALEAALQIALEALEMPTTSPSTASPAVSAFETPEPPGPLRLRLWRRADLAPLVAALPSAPTGGWILPAADADPTADAALGVAVGYWLPPVSGPEAADTLAPLVEALPPEAELLCLSWEAFALRARYPARAFRLDWTFNLANRAAVDLVHRAGLAATAAPEATAPLPGAVALARTNPLVSLSRFPPAPKDPTTFTNPHGDRFTRLPLGEGVHALFLHRAAAPLPSPAGAPGAQLDVLLLTPEDPAAVASWLTAPWRE